MSCVDFWTNVLSPDLFHYCHPFQNGGGFKPPNTGYGYQPPSMGDGYIHFGYSVYQQTPNYYEIPVSILDNPLKIDSSYCFKVMVNPADCTHAITASFEILFTVDSLSEPSPPKRLTRTDAQYKHPSGNYFVNFNAWKPITGKFKADSAYKYMAFGYFGLDQDFEWKQFRQGQNSHQNVSLFLDRVYLLHCSQVDSAEAGTGGFACLEENKSFELGVPNSDGHSWEWWPTLGLDNPNISNPVAQPLETTTYHLKMVNYMHDTLYDSVTIYIDVCRPKFPNIITPNGDLQNDAFEIENLPPGSSVKIFNQWGMEVFSSPNYQNNFDGTSSTGNLSEGVYYYTLEYDFLEERKDTTGYFHLFR